MFEIEIHSISLNPYRLRSKQISPYLLEKFFEDHPWYTSALHSNFITNYMGMGFFFLHMRGEHTACPAERCSCLLKGMMNLKTFRERK